MVVDVNQSPIRVSAHDIQSSDLYGCQPQIQRYRSLLDVKTKEGSGERDHEIVEQVDAVDGHSARVRFTGWETR